MDPAGVDVGGGAVGVAAEVAGGVHVAEEVERSMSQTWRWGEGPNNWGDKSDPGPAGSTGRRRRHGTPQSAPPGHGDPGG